MDMLTVDQATNVEAQNPPGGYTVRLWLDHEPTQDEVHDIFNYLDWNGIEIHEVRSGVDGNAPYIDINYVKTAPTPGISFLPLALIPLIGFGLVIGLIGIGIFKWHSIVNETVKLVLVVGGVGIALAILLRKPIEKVAERI